MVTCIIAAKCHETSNILKYKNMKIVNTKSLLADQLNHWKSMGKSIGFVPTMGALHSGHISLVAASKSENDITVVSIFVNPTQFNDKNDLKNYPRTFKEDTSKLEQAGVDLVFAPGEAEMYPEPDTRVFNFGNLDQIMEGAHRPGHFNGVAQIVSKFFEAVDPNNAYFGEKDFQQLAIIKQLVKQIGYKVKIVPCPIVRETDGLAMSSRNVLLSAGQRKSAVLISKTLFASKNKINDLTVEDIKKWVIQSINSDSNLEVEYFEIVDDTSLNPVISWNDPGIKVGCVAVKVGKIRLIDNIKYNS
jgi:pantoate--beta-alanine ligase